MSLNHAGVDVVQGAQVSGDGCAANCVVLDGALCDQCASQAVGGGAQGCHALCDGVDELADGVDLGVNHFVNGDEAGAGHVPVSVLQQQVQVVQVVQTCLENLGNALAFFEGQAGCGVVCKCHDGLLHDAVMFVVRWGLRAPPNRYYE
ncbi:Uncharacterised protein [Mycobacterium tuberculosis]|nr:Uncharacterised protein [Mycobacterium tuberculosis]